MLLVLNQYLSCGKQVPFTCCRLDEANSATKSHLLSPQSSHLTASRRRQRGSLRDIVNCGIILLNFYFGAILNDRQ
jgi:hypothetical protein